MKTNQSKDDFIVTYKNTSHLKYDIVVSLNLGTVVAKFIDVARFIKIAKFTAQLYLITGVPKVINGKRATVDNFRDAQMCS